MNPVNKKETKGNPYYDCYYCINYWFDRKHYGCRKDLRATPTGTSDLGLGLRNSFACEGFEKIKI